MKKLIYVITFISCGFLHPILGAQLQERVWDSRVAHVAVALRNDPDALQEFLEIAAESQPTPTRVSELHPQRTDDEELEDPTGYACIPVRAEEQIRLSVNDIINNSENSRQLSKVFYVDLNDFDFGTASAPRQCIFDYFSTNNLYNLRTIHFRNSRGGTRLIEELFGNDKPRDKFVSLFRINAESSDITSQDIETIYHHFSGYTYFIRDLRQISARFGGVGAFLSLEVREVENLGNIGSWQIGKKTTSSNYQILYRSHDANAKGSFIMSVES